MSEIFCASCGKLLSQDGDEYIEPGVVVVGDKAYCLWCCPDMQYGEEDPPENEEE